MTYEKAREVIIVKNWPNLEKISHLGDFVA
jgi:hypothetical protein